MYELGGYFMRGRIDPLRLEIHCRHHQHGCYRPISLDNLPHIRSLIAYAIKISIFTRSSVDSDSMVSVHGREWRAEKAFSREAKEVFREASV